MDGQIQVTTPNRSLGLQMYSIATMPRNQWLPLQDSQGALIPLQIRIGAHAEVEARWV
jgi:hypothetical protein